MNKRKGGIALGIGIALVVLGLVGGVIGLVVGFQSVQKRIDDLERVSLFQGGTIRLDEAGTYKVFVERPTSGGGTPVGQIIAPDGTPIAIEGVAEDEDYDIGGRHGKLLGSFSAPEAGRYEFLVTPAMGQRNGPGQFAVGKNSPEGALIGMGAAIFGGIVTVVIGIILIIVGAVRRSRSKRPPTSGYPQQGWGQAPSGAPAPGGWAPPPAQPWNAPPGPGPGPAAGPPPSGPPPGPSWNPPQTGGDTSWNPPPSSPSS